MDEFESMFSLDGSHLFRPDVVSVGGGGPQAEEPQLGDQVEIPDELAILPLRGMVVYPVTAVPLTVGQARSVKLIDDAVLEKKIVGLVASKNPELEEPGPDDCYTVGTAAAVQRLLRLPDGTVRLIVLGLERIRIEQYTQATPYLRARVSRAKEIQEETVEMEALKRKALELFSRLVELIPGVPDELASMAASIEDPRQLVYAITTYIRIELADAQEILELDQVGAKLRKVVTLLTRELEVLQVLGNLKVARRTTVVLTALQVGERRPLGK